MGRLVLSTVEWAGGILVATHRPNPQATAKCHAQSRGRIYLERRNDPRPFSQSADARTKFAPKWNAPAQI